MLLFMSFSGCSPRSSKNALRALLDRRYTNLAAVLLRLRKGRREMRYERMPSSQSDQLFFLFRSQSVCQSSLTVSLYVSLCTSLFIHAFLTCLTVSPHGFNSLALLQYILSVFYLEVLTHSRLLLPFLPLFFFHSFFPSVFSQFSI